MAVSPEKTSTAPTDQHTTPPTPPTTTSSSPQKIQPLDLFGTGTVENLSNGFLAVLEPDLMRVRQSLDELVINQDEMLHSIHDKRTQFEDSTKAAEIQAMLQKVPHYRQRVAALTKQMQGLSKRVKRLQQRAAKLKELRIQRDVQKRKEMERKLAQERLLEAKPSK